MPIDLTFNSPINMSCKIGDVAYYTPTSTQGGFTVDNNTFLIGVINSIIDNGTTVVINCETTGESAELVTQEDFVFFSKNNLLELKSLRGYYGQAKFLNNSPHPAEMYATSCGVDESSK
tara:strand:- start:1386 stop:1742 length:357 start_codon:yes stop_codon:yes gene_type:complete